MKEKRCAGITRCLVLLGFLTFLTVPVFALQNSARQEYAKIRMIEDPAERVQALKTFIQKTEDPKFKRYAYSTLLSTYINDLKQYDSAIELAKKLLKEHPDKDYQQIGYLNLLLAYRETDPDKFEQLGLKLLEGDTDGDIQALALNVLKTYWAEKDPQKLRLLAQKALESHIQEGLVFNNLAWSLIDKDIDPQLGVKLALAGEKLITEEHYRKRYPNLDEKRLKGLVNTYRSHIKDTIGWGYFKMGQYQKAKTFLEEAQRLSLRPSPDVDMHLGAVLAKLGQAEKAKTMVLEAVLKTSSQEGIQILADIMGTNVESAKAFVLKERFKRAKPAPDFTLKDLNGNEHTLSKYRGKVVLVNFFQPT